MRRYVNVTLVILACALAPLPGVPFAAALLSSQSTTVSGVTATATPLVITGDRWEFEIVLETHAGDLGDDLLISAVLVTDHGSMLRPLAWRGDRAGGHHRKGVLVFQAPKSRPAAVELRITRRGEPGPRVFTWQLS